MQAVQWEIMGRYRSAYERLSKDARREIASHAARIRHEQRPRKTPPCVCSDPENEHWSVGIRDCRACDLRGELDRCPGFTPDPDFVH